MPDYNDGSAAVRGKTRAMDCCAKPTRKGTRKGEVLFLPNLGDFLQARWDESQMFGAFGGDSVSDDALDLVELADRTTQLQGARGKSPLGSAILRARVNPKGPRKLASHYPTSKTSYTFGHINPGVRR